MTSGSFRFEGFVLDCEERHLRRNGLPVELTGRYFDALALMLRHPGTLISRDRFLDEVWCGVPVTDEALTQCVRTIRRQLGDDAARPRFIETVPKYGYRFIAAVDRDDPPATPTGIEASEDTARPDYALRDFLLLGGAGTAGASVSGLIGGIAYGFVAASRAGAGAGGISALLVLLWLTIMVAATGGAGVSFGIAAAGFLRNRAWTIVGGAAGGAFVGGMVKLLGIDAFDLLLGRSPGDITGAPEGLVLGGAVGAAAWLVAGAGRPMRMRQQIAIAALAGGAGAFLIVFAGGRLMGGSLDLLASTFPTSRLRIYPAHGFSGGFGSIFPIVSGVGEGVLFSGCIVTAMLLARSAISARRKRHTPGAAQI
ncbi:winged helix-turn-helix domain-containing protein [Stakelama saccharophila]|uniref:Transcriptional regulator n=1 Tax=Stakelama saccharophila TaxID=3075605 RepID=A0ABZ0BC92_9SPHN|nr:transcriptional regulator [Stakelama sp. W311]WNO54685.1 transcriptional regulator [Stakelama sp. W311]